MFYELDPIRLGATDGEIIAVDGKTARGSRDRKNNRYPPHRVSANRLSIGPTGNGWQIQRDHNHPKTTEMAGAQGVYRQYWCNGLL